MLGALALAGCGGGGGGPGPGPTPVITKTGGDNQVGPAGQALGALEVTVKDGSGAALSGLTVTWSAASGGGSVSPPTSVTGADGKATTVRTLGTGAGAQTTSASVTGATAVTFSHVAQIQGATQIAASGSATRSDSVKSTVPFAVIVKDQNNANIAGVIVSWAVTAGGGLLSQAVDTTDAGGISTVNLTLSQGAVAQTATATVTGLVGSPVTFTDNATAGNAVSMTLNGGNNQAGPVSTALPTPHSVIVRDAYNNPKSAFSVSWTVGVGGGSITPSGAAITNGSGIASVTRTLGAAAGVHTDTASATGLGTVVFTDTAAALVGIQVNNNVFNPATDTTAAGAFAVFTWAGGASHNVTWDTAPAGGLPPNSTTQPSGTFTTRLTKVGTYTYYCTIHGSPGAGMHGTLVAQ
jgi:plastocyanin